MPSSLSDAAPLNTLATRTPLAPAASRGTSARVPFWSVAIWSALGAGFLFLGAPRVWEAVRESHFGPALPYHTTNSYLLSLLKISDGSERLLRVFAALPTSRPVAVILPEGNDDAIFLEYVLSYFAWPREVQSIAVTRANARARLQSLDRDSLGAIFFCKLPPPPELGPRLQIGSSIVMVPLSPKTSAP